MPPIFNSRPSNDGPRAEAWRVETDPEGAARPAQPVLSRRRIRAQRLKPSGRQRRRGWFGCSRMMHERHDGPCNSSRGRNPGWSILPIVGSGLRRASADESSRRNRSTDLESSGWLNSDSPFEYGRCRICEDEAVPAPARSASCGADLPPGEKSRRDACATSRDRPTHSFTTP